MLCEVISLVRFSFSPVYYELPLSHPVSNPVEPHVDCFGAPLFDVIVRNACCSAVVGDDGRGRLWVAKFLEGNADGTSFLSVVEKSGDFSFSSA